MADVTYENFSHFHSLSFVFNPQSPSVYSHWIFSLHVVVELHLEPSSFMNFLLFQFLQFTRHRNFPFTEAEYYLVYAFHSVSICESKLPVIRGNIWIETKNIRCFFRWFFAWINTVEDPCKRNSKLWVVKIVPMFPQCLPIL